jgi:hypothetical protein
MRTKRIRLKLRAFSLYHKILRSQGFLFFSDKSDGSGEPLVSFASGQACPQVRQQPPHPFFFPRRKAAITPAAISPIKMRSAMIFPPFCYRSTASAVCHLKISGQTLKKRG